MSLLTGFFKESDTQLGVFYPKHYLIAVFRDSRAAQQAVKDLWTEGFAQDEAIAVTGQEFVDLAKEETGPGNFVMQALSRFFATEQKTHDSDLERAHHSLSHEAVRVRVARGPVGPRQDHPLDEGGDEEEEVDGAEGFVANEVADAAEDRGEVEDEVEG